MHFSVNTAIGRADAPCFKLVSYPTGRLSWVVESNERWPTRTEAEAACKRANEGDHAGLTFASYADD